MADNMTGIKIKALPEATTLSDDMDLIVEDTAPKTWRTKLSQLAKKIIGTNDISKIGDGTCTGAIATLNDSLSNTNSVILTPTGNTNITDQFSMRIGNMIVLDFWFKCTDYIPYNYAVADIPMNTIQRFDLFGIDDKSTPYFFYTEGTAIRALTPILANSNVMIKGIIFV